MPRLARLTLFFILSVVFVGAANAQSNQQFVFVAEPQAIEVFTLNSTAGVLAPVAGNPFADTHTPVWLAVTSPAAYSAVPFLFVANSGTPSISVFAIAPSGALTEIAGSPFAVPDCTPAVIMVSGDNLTLFVAGSGTVDSFAINPNTGALTEVDSLAGPTSPVGMNLGSAIYVLGVNEGQFYVPRANSTLVVAGSPILFSGTATALLTDGTFLFVARNDSGSGYIDVIMNEAVVPTQTYDAGGVVDSLALCDGFVFSNENTFQVAGLYGSLSPTNLNWVNAPPFSIASDPNTSFLFVGNKASAGTVPEIAPMVVGSNSAVTDTEPPLALGGFASQILAATGLTPASTAPAFFWSPSQPVVFGLTTDGQSHTEQVQIISTGGSPLTFTDVSVSGDASFTQTSNCSASLSPGSNCNVEITFAPTLAGTFNATLNLVGNVTGSLALSGTGVGVPPPPQYTLTTATIGSGSINQSPAGTSFASGTAISLTAVPAANFVFTSWTGACAGSTNPVCSFAIAANTTAVATFAATSPTQAQYSLSVLIIGPGTVTPQAGSYAAGAAIALAASPTGTATFSGWSGTQCNGSSNTTCAFSMPASNVSLGATFTAAVPPSLAIAPSTQSGNAGNVFQFTVTPVGFSATPTIATTCSIPMGTCTVSGSIVNVTTTAPSASAVNMIRWLTPLGLGLLALFCLPARKRKAIICAATLCALSACGAVPAPVHTGTAGTTAGTYAITVSAASGTQKATGTASLLIQ